MAFSATYHHLSLYPSPPAMLNPFNIMTLLTCNRHGWGCTPNPSEAVKFLSAAASNAAGIEELALQAGMKKGGAAKGELVLAIFELANCFRHGWGVGVDKFAAKQVRASLSIGPGRSLSFGMTMRADDVGGV
jgi:TPR repeat protein